MICPSRNEWGELMKFTGFTADDLQGFCKEEYGVVKPKNDTQTANLWLNIMGQWAVREGYFEHHYEAVNSIWKVACRNMPATDVACNWMRQVEPPLPVSKEVVNDQPPEDIQC